MDRREFLLVALGMLATGGASAAGPRRVGILADTPGPHWQVFRQALAQLGYIEGKTLALEWRWAEGQFGRFPKLAADLVQLKVDVIVAEGGPAAQAAKTANATIPIVMAISADPVGLGLVQSLTRPGGNVTGSSSRSPELYAKQLQLLKEIKPGLRRVAVLWHPGFPSSQLATKEVVSGAETLGLQLHLMEARDVATAFSLLANQPADALLVIANPSFDGLQAQIARLAAEARLPAVYNKGVFAKEGGLLSYGARYSDFFHRAAYYVDKILNGANPADLPVQEATTFELVINLKTARTLGVTISPQVLLRADQVIE
jgi:putative tryptophan/tyrosine transport system substrate-binding protein